MTNQFIDMLRECVRKDITLDKLQELYLNRSTSYVRPDTLAYYEKQLNVIIPFFKKQCNVFTTSELTQEHLLKFVLHSRNRGNKNNTISKRINTLKQAFKWCVQKSYITTNNIETFEPLPKEYQETKVIDEQYLVQIFNYLNTLEPTVTNLRNKLIVYLLFDTAVRANELVHIEYKNINFREKTIRLTFTKTKENRTVCLSDITYNVLREYCQILENKSGYLIINFQSGERLLSRSLNKILDNIKKDLKIPKEVSISPHKFRHTLATQLLQGGANIREVQSYLGHKDITSTMKYTHINDDNLKSMHNKCSPLNKIEKKSEDTKKGTKE